MKTPGKVFTLDDEDYENDTAFSYWTITSSLSDQKLIYRLNNALDSNFHRCKRDHQSHFKGHHFEHVTYTWFDSYSEVQWCILMNRGLSLSETGEKLSRNLVSSKQPIDFILVAMDEVEDDQIQSVLSTIKKTQGVAYAMALEPSEKQLPELNIELENILL